MKEDLTTSSVFSNTRIEENIIKNALFQFFLGELENAEHMLDMIHEDYFRHKNTKHKYILLIRKLRMLIEAMHNEREAFISLYEDYLEEKENNPKKDFSYPSQKLDNLLELFNQMYNCKLFY